MTQSQENLDAQIILEASVMFFKITGDYLRPSKFQAYQKIMQHIFKTVTICPEIDDDWKTFICFILLNMLLSSNQKKEANDILEQLTSNLSKSCPYLFSKITAKANAAGLPFAERLVVASLSPSKLLLDVGYIALKYGLPDVTDGCCDALEKYFKENNVKSFSDKAELDILRYAALAGKCATFGNPEKDASSEIDKEFQLSSLLTSVNYPLRCQVHWFLAKCYADRDLSEEAFRELSKARSFDDNLKYSDSMDHFEFCLNSRTKLYTTPEKPAERARQLIEHVVATVMSPNRQIRSSFCCNFKTAENFALPDENANLIKCNSPALRSLLLEAGAILAPGKFKELVRLSEGLSNALADRTGSSGSELNVHLHDVNEKLREFRENWEKSEGMIADGTQLLEKSDNQEKDESLKAYAKHQRFLLFADLARTAFFMQLWDLSRVATYFALKDEGFTDRHRILSRTAVLSRDRNDRHLSLRKCVCIKMPVEAIESLKATHAQIQSTLAFLVQAVDNQLPQPNSSTRRRVSMNSLSLCSSYPQPSVHSLDRIVWSCLIIRQLLPGLPVVGDFNSDAFFAPNVELSDSAVTGGLLRLLRTVANVWALILTNEEKVNKSNLTHDISLADFCAELRLWIGLAETAFTSPSLHWAIDDVRSWVRKRLAQQAPEVREHAETAYWLARLEITSAAAIVAAADAKFAGARAVISASTKTQSKQVRQLIVSETEEVAALQGQNADGTNSATSSAAAAAAAVMAETSAKIAEERLFRAIWKLLINLIIGRAQLDQPVESLMYLLGRSPTNMWNYLDVLLEATRSCKFGGSDDSEKIRLLKEAINTALDTEFVLDPDIRGSGQCQDSVEAPSAPVKSTKTLNKKGVELGSRKNTQTDIVVDKDQT
ncbi:unnamed protein product [Schistocephalus solidus]|uniref:DOCKER domain-containing protein n=1 Tax=Schistocephalus solidus TaxID=70667 RepID=A0A183SHB8_SCHSO|nr:unnamed protein product [Schistocephalus solidus]